MATSVDRQSRKNGAILGMYVGDALAMPVHWNYDRRALARDYGRVTGYLAPKNPHPDSILWRSAHTPVNAKADILHDQGRFWGRPGVHYHQFLQAGENTLNLKICTLLLKHLNENVGYDADAYLAVYFAEDPDRARRAAFEHLGHTHLGARMQAAGELLMDVLLPVLGGEDIVDVIAEKIRRQDTPLLGHPLMRWLDDPDEIVVGRRLSSACYVEDALPATTYLALKYHAEMARGLVANTNLGGDNAGRGAVLGALLGAANGYGAFPESWVKGLCHPPPELRGS